MEKISIGAKFFKFDEDNNLRVIRIKSVPSEKAKSQYVTYIDEDGSLHRMSIQFLMNNYTLLKPDGMIMFSIVSVGEADDVLVALKSFKTDDMMPYAICRQALSDVFSNNLTDPKPDGSGIHYLGISISQDTCPANVDFKITMECTGIKYNKPVAIYLDDTFEEIIGLFGHTKYDNTLKSFKKKTQEIAASDGNNVVYMGFCESLVDLLTTNNFMYDFRKCFKIMELPFSIKKSLETEALNAQNILFLENELKANIMETYVVKYDKSIDLKSIKRDYILASSTMDAYDAVYLVGYDLSDGEYVPRTSI